MSAHKHTYMHAKFSRRHFDIDGSAVFQCMRASLESMLITHVVRTRMCVCKVIRNILPYFSECEIL